MLNKATYKNNFLENNAILALPILPLIRQNLPVDNSNLQLDK